MDDNTPVIIGVGEASERIDATGYEALSPADLAGRAAAAAVADAGGAADLAAHIQVVAAIRQCSEVSGPPRRGPFGCGSDNRPGAPWLARRIGADPRRAVLEPVGGQGPQHLVNEFAQAIGAGETDLVLLCGSEAISTVRHLTSNGESRDWSETIGGELEDRGFGDALMTADLPRHGARTPISVYAMFENARRARLGMNRADYALEMGRLFAPFTKVAASNPHAMSRDVHSAEDLATVTKSNRLTSDPYPRRMVARDQANQGAAVLMSSVGKARALGVPEDRWVYLHGGADARERTPIERADLSVGPASSMAIRQALDVAGVGVGAIGAFDFYSCFPIAVFNVRDALGISADDPRPLTVTGGLPYFGGAGNNYSMHGIASMVRHLRAHPGELGLVAANGGFLSKYSVGVYSTRPAPWRGFDSKALQAEIDSWPAPVIASGEGAGIVETYTIDYSGPAPVATVIGRLEGGEERFIAMTDPAEPALAKRMIETDPLQRRRGPLDEQRGPIDRLGLHAGRACRAILRTTGTMKWHFADVFETVAALVPDNIALVNGEVRRTWREYEDRGARVARALADAGLGPDSKVGLYGYNSNEYLEAQFGVFKLRAIPVNVNYRYVEHELLYLLENADAEAIVFDAQFAPRLAAIRDRLPKLKLFIRIDDGSGEPLPGALDFEAVIAGHGPLPRQEYDENDIYMLYTGGTTGMPKGVMYRQGDFVLGLGCQVLGP